MKSINWELVLKILAGFVGILSALYQFRQYNPGKRAKLKADIEILEKFDKSDPNYSIVKNYIDSTIRVLYQDAESKFKIYSPKDFFAGLVIIIVFTVWSVYIYQNNSGFSFWIIITGFLALVGIGGVLNGVDPNKKKS